MRLSCATWLQEAFPSAWEWEEGRELCPILEFSYKNDDLGDPFINDDYALALGLATKERRLTRSGSYTLKVNEIMKEYFLNAGMKLIDFKIEFGRFHGQILLADEVSPIPAVCGT